MLKKMVSILDKCVETWDRSQLKESVDELEPFITFGLSVLEKPGVLNLTRSALALGKSISNRNRDPYNLFSDYDSIENAQLVSLIWKFAHHLPRKQIAIDSRLYNCFEIDLNGIKIKCLEVISLKMWSPEMWIDPADYQKLFVFLKNAIFGEMDSIILSQVVVGNKKVWMFNDDNLIEAKNSDLADQYAANFDKALKVGVNRSIFIYGPPGTGKSTLSRQICKNLGLKYLRINISDLSSTDHLMNLIDILQPDAIIIDDFERVYDQESMLDFIPNLRKNIKLLIATANQPELLDPAILRPQRFDEMLEVNVLDKVAILHLLNGDPDDIYETVKSWPISFIEEYHTRRKWLSKDEALDSLKELERRVSNQENFDADDARAIETRNNQRKKIAKKKRNYLDDLR